MEIPKLTFNEAKPTIAFGEIRDVMIAQVGYPLVSYDKAYIEGRINNAGDDADALRLLTVIGDKPVPESTAIEISHDREIFTPKKHTLNARLDENNDQNYNFVRGLEEDGVVAVLMWYITRSGKLYGGLSGIKATLKFDELIPEADSEISTLPGVFTWKGNHPERVNNPLVEDEDAPDTIPPTAKFTPNNGATGIASDVTVTIELSEAIRKTGGEELDDNNIADVLTLVDSGAGAVAFDAVFLYTKKNITIQPSAALGSDTFTVGISGVEDYAGNALVAVTSDFTTV